MKEKLSPRNDLLKQVSLALMQVGHGFGYLFGQPKSNEATMLQIQVLSFLRVKPHSTARDIGKALYLSSSATTQLVQRMFDAGWLERTNDAKDRRIVKLSMTEKGADVLWNYGKTRSEVSKNVFSALSDEELEKFLLILDKLHNKMQEALNNDKKIK